MKATLIPGVKNLIIFLLIISFSWLFTPACDAQVPLRNQTRKVQVSNWRNDLRTALNQKGVYLNAIYTGELFSNRKGGVRRGTEYLDVIDLMLTLKLDSLINWRHTTFSMDLMGIHGGNPSDYAGDIQGVSDIAAASSWRLGEVWLQQNLLNDKMSTLIGVYDLNSEFDVIETSGLFLHSSYSMGPEFSHSGKNGAPTYPYPGLAIRVKTRLSEKIRVQAAIMDGVPGDPYNPKSTQYGISRAEGALFSTELIYLTGEERVTLFPPVSRRIQNRRRRIGYGGLRDFPQRGGPRRERGGQPRVEIPQQSYSKVAIGGWYYTSEFDDLADRNLDGNPVTHRGNWGIYGLGEKILFTKEGNPSEFASAFFRAGISDKNVNYIDAYLGCGIVFSRSFIRHDLDQIGLAAAAAHISNKFDDISGTGNETNNDWEVALELSYRAQVNSIFSLQPDIQYVFNPGFDPSVENALLVGMRAELSFQ